MSLRLTSIIAAFAVTSILSSTQHCSAAEPSQPNVLLICVDDLKPNLGCYGDPLAKTPNIDHLASTGVLFEKAFCNQAVCSPSRNALLTALRPQSLGIYDLGTNFRAARPDAVTLGQFFQKHGYRTEALGKVFHVGHGNREDTASWSVPHWRPKAPGYVLPISTADTRDSARGPRGRSTESADVPDNTYGDGLIADEAIRRLQAARQNPGQPFLLAVGFVKPHLPFVAPTRYWNLFQPDSFPLPLLTSAPVGAPDYAPSSGGELRQYSDIPPNGAFTDQQTRHLIHGYYAATSYVDAQIGRVLATLRSTELSTNTVVVLWGDHGWHLGDHGMWCKHSNYEQAARIPLIISAPGMSTGVTSQALVESVDIYPTLAELAGLPQPEGVDGTSFVKVLQDSSASARDHAIHVYPRGQRIGRAIRTDRYRLVEWRNAGAAADTAEWELYDYEADPAESRNLAEDQPSVVAELQAILKRHPEPKPQIKNAAAQPTVPKASTAKKKQPQDRNAMFDRRDRNQDGKLTREEFLSGQPDPEEAPKRFIRFDVDGNGVLSREEFVNSGRKSATKNR